MKNSKKFLSFLTASTMLFAYAIPFVHAEDTAALNGGAEVVEAAAEACTWDFAAAPEGIVVPNKDNKNKEWYTGTTDLGNGLTAYSTDTFNDTKKEYSNAFEIDRTSSTDFGDETVVGALKFGGKSSATGRYFTYNPADAGTLTVYVKHGSPGGSDTRTLTVTQGSNTTDISVTAPDNPYVKQTIEIAASTQVKIAAGGNVALAKLVYTPGSTVEDPTATPSETVTEAVTESVTEAATTAPSEDATEQATETAPALVDAPAAVAVGAGVQWSANDIAAATYNSLTEHNGLYIGAAADAAVVIDASKADIGGRVYTQRIKTGGTGNTETGVRCLYFKPDTDVEAVIDMTSSSGDAARTVEVIQGSNVQTFTVSAKEAFTTSILKANETVIIRSASGGLNIYGITLTPKVATEPPEVTDAPALVEAPAAVAVGTGVQWSANDIAAATYDSLIEHNGLYIGAAADAAVVVDANSATIDGRAYTQRIKTGGTGNTETGVRCLYFKPDADVEAVIDMTSSSGSAARVVEVVQGANVQTFEVSDKAAFTASNLKANETVIIRSTSGGLNVYGITLTPKAAGTVAPATQTPNATATPGAATDEPDTGEGVVWIASEDVKAGVPLMEGLSAVSDMPYKSAAHTFSDGLATTGYVAHSENGAWMDGEAIAGSALKFTAPTVGKVYAYITGLGDGKKVYLAEQNCCQTSKELDSTAAAIVTGNGSDIILSGEVEQGKTYYILGTGTKARFCAVKFVSTGEATTPTPGPTLDPDATPTPYVSPDEAAVDEAVEKLRLNAISQTAIYSDIDLPMTYNKDRQMSITWESSNKNYIDVQMISHIKNNYTGVVTRPRADDANIIDGGVPVTLTATITRGDYTKTKTFDVSVRTWNPMYYNDFQQDVGKAAEGTYKAIADNVEAANGDKFRGIRVDTLKDSRAFEAFGNGDKDVPTIFDKRVMSATATRDNAANEENFAFYYSEHNPYGGGTTYTPLWVKLIDPATGQAPEGVVLLNMDLYVITTNQKFSMGFGPSTAKQMCRFTLNNASKVNSGLGYDGGGSLRPFDAESYTDFKGGTAGYRIPVGDWVRATIIANSESHKWDFYFDGMQIGTNLNFRNAEDMISTIEFTMDRSYGGGSYLIDNIYVENMTSDYTNTYWDEVTPYTLKAGEKENTYIVDASALLPYEGQNGLKGKFFNWKSSDSSILSIAKTRIPVEDLINYGYTEEQIASYKSANVKDITVIKADPAKLTEDKTVTITAYLDVGDDTLEKSFEVIVKANTGSDPTATQTPTARPTTKPNNTGSGGGGGGGGGTPVKGASGGGIAANVVPIIVDNPTPQPTLRPADAPAFDDLYLVPWAQEAINYLYAKDIVDGYGNGLYGVNDNVTREQFVKMLISSLHLRLFKEEHSKFNDVSDSDWYAVYVNSAVKLGIVTGISDTEFGVGAPISRQDMAVMANRALEVIEAADADDEIFDETVDVPDTTEEPTAAPEDAADADEEPTAAPVDDPDESDEEAETLISNMTFGDKGNIADYAAVAVAKMADGGYLNGDENGNFNPTDNSTRAQTAVMIYRIIK